MTLCLNADFDRILRALCQFVAKGDVTNVPSGTPEIPNMGAPLALAQPREVLC